MPQKKEPTHVLLLRAGKYEIQALGIPAIAAVVVILLLGARWLGLI